MLLQFGSRRLPSIPDGTYRDQFLQAPVTHRPIHSRSECHFLSELPSHSATAKILNLESCFADRETLRR